eukprot:gene1006-9912_t
MSGVIKEGILKKDPGFFGAKSRFFELNSEKNVLNCYEQKSGSNKFVGALDLSSPSSVIIDIIDQKKKFIFKITAFADSWKLQAPSEGEMNGWINSIKDMMENAKRIKEAPKVVEKVETKVELKPQLEIKEEPKKEEVPKNTKKKDDSEDEPVKPMTKRKVNIKEDSDSEDDEPVKKPVKKSEKKMDSSDEEPTPKPKRKVVLKDDSDSDNEPVKPKRKVNIKDDSDSEDEPVKKPVKKVTKKLDSEDEEPTKSETAKTQMTTKKPLGKAISKKIDSSSDDETPKKIVKRTVKKKVDSSSDDDEPVKKPMGRKVVKKIDSSSEDETPKKIVKRTVKKRADSSSDDEPVKKTTAKKNKKKIDTSSDDEPKKVVKKVIKKKLDTSSDDEPKKVIKKVVKKKIDSSSDSDDVKKKPTPKKGKKNNSDTDSDDLMKGESIASVSVKKEIATSSDDEPKKVVKKKVYSSDSDDEPKKKKLVKKAPKKKVDDSDDDSDSPSNKKPIKKKPQPKKPITSSDDDSGKEVPKKKVIKKKMSSSDDDSGKEVPKKQIKKKPITSSDDDSGKEVPKKKVIKKDSSDDDSGKEKPQVQKKPTNDDTSDDDSGNEREHRKEHNSDEEVEKMKKNIIKEFKIPNSIREAIQKLDYFLMDEKIVIQIIDYLEEEREDDEDEFINQIIKNDGLQTFVSTTEMHYDKPEIMEKLLPHIYNISKGDESRYHLIRLMNGVDIMSKYMCQFDKDHLPKKYFRFAFQIFEFVLTKKTDYSTEYLTKKSGELSKIIVLGNELILTDKKFANSFAKFVYNLSLYEGNVHILFNCGATTPMIKIVETYCEKNLDILIYFHQYITFMKPEEYQIMSDLFSQEGSKGPIRILILDVMSKNDTNTQIQNICADILQRMSRNEEILTSIYEIWTENSEDQALSFCVSRIIQSLTFKGDVPKEILVNYANSPMIKLCVALMKGFPGIGWIISCCAEFIGHLLKNCEKKDKEKVIKEFSKSDGINSLVVALHEYSANEEFANLIISIFDEFSKDERGISSLKKSTGILPQIFDYIEIYSSNKKSAKLAFEVLIRYSKETDFGDKNEISKEVVEEYLSFILKKIEDAKNDITTTIFGFTILKAMSDDEFIPQLSTSNSRMLFDNYQNNLKNDTNDELLILVFEVFGKLGKDNKNRAIFSKQQIVENLKKLYKQHSSKPEVKSAAKEAKKSLGI